MKPHSFAATFSVNLTPEVDCQQGGERYLDPTAKEVLHNPTCQALYAPGAQKHKQKTKRTITLTYLTDQCKDPPLFMAKAMRVVTKTALQAM